jgi:hypothetical protein
MTTRDEKLRTSWNTILACSKRYIFLGNILVGFLVCISIPLMLTHLFRNAHGDDVIPLVFLVVVGLVAHFLGTTSAIVGLLSAAYVFADFLFAPAGLAVEDKSARTNLILMLLFGLAIAYFYGVEARKHGSVTRPRYWAAYQPLRHEYCRPAFQCRTVLLAARSDHSRRPLSRFGDLVGLRNHEEIGRLWAFLNIVQFGPSLTHVPLDYIIQLGIDPDVIGRPIGIRALVLNGPPSIEYVIPDLCASQLPARGLLPIGTSVLGIAGTKIL